MSFRPETSNVTMPRWDLAAVEAFLWREGEDAGWPIARSPRDIRIVAAGGAGVKMTCLVPWGGGTTSVTRPVPPDNTIL